MSIVRHLGAALCIAVAAFGAAQAQNREPDWGRDVAGAKDHPLVRRFEGAWLAGYQQREFDEARWPGGPEAAKSDQLKTVERAEGRVTRLVYITPRGKTPLEVYRNHEQALLAAGAKPVFACETSCDRLFWAWHHQLHPQDGLTWASGFLTTPKNARYAVTSPVTSEEARIWVGSIAKPGAAPVHILLATSVASNSLTGFAATLLQIVEPKAMQTGQVVVDAKAISQGLEADGKVALYGLYFDTGKADIKPESRPQLDEMASVLQKLGTARVFIVGHTDNVGGFEANMALSLARAQAVVAALQAAPYRIKPERLSAKGAANIAPIATNASDDGRGRNRRVEMVLQ